MYKQWRMVNKNDDMKMRNACRDIQPHNKTRNEVLRRCKTILSLTDSQSTLFTKQCYDKKTKNHEMGGTFSKNGDDNK